MGGGTSWLGLIERVKVASGWTFGFLGSRHLYFAKLFTSLSALTAPLTFLFRKEEDRT